MIIMLEVMDKGTGLSLVRFSLMENLYIFELKDRLPELNLVDWPLFWRDGFFYMHADKR